MQSFPSLKKKVDDESDVMRAGNASAGSFDLRKVATSVRTCGEEQDVSGSREGQEKLRRRYSSGNMREQHSEESDKHDEDTDHEGHVFHMDETSPARRESVVPTYAQARKNWAERCYEIERTKRVHSEENHPVPAQKPQEDENVHVETDGSTTRTEWFLLIEDLTKNMIRPCVLDLKMGTRQYGYLA